MLGSFILAVVILALIPGPDNIYVLIQSSLHGPRAGLLVTLGLCCGLLVHTLGVILGLAALIAASALAFTVIKLLGAAYLLYLAWQALRQPPPSLDGQAPLLSARLLVVRGLLMNVSNPKVAIFFLAFLPLFTDPQAGHLTLQLLILGALFIPVTLVVFGGIALAAGRLGPWLRQRPRLQRGLQGSASVVLAALALRLAISER